MKSIILLLLSLPLLHACAWQPVAPSTSDSPSAAIASAHPLATEAGMAVLAEGGNAFDAAITVAAMLAVVEPFGSGLGGGGFWLLYDQEQDKNIFVDGREKAPLAASATMYQNEKGKVDRALATNHPLAAAIPGTPAAMVHLQRNYGSLPLQRLLAPAIAVAEQGFAVSSEYQDAVRMRLTELKNWPSASIFLENGQVPSLGWQLRQPELADTLRAIAAEGRQGFYAGEIAKDMVDEVQANGGFWTLKDLEQYQVVEREPIQFEYQGHKIISSPLPSSGGLVMGSIFGQLEALDYELVPSADQMHLLVEAMRNAYHQRALFMGDADFTGNQGMEMLEPETIRSLTQRISLTRAQKSADLPQVTAGTQGKQTTHFSILDGQGNRVAATLSINTYFGSGYVAKGTGVLLNNEMDDFSALAGAPNAYGLIGNHANSIQPGKRPLSSMSPTFVESPAGVHILGTPGGSRIISMVTLAILDAVAQKDVDAIVAAPRVHHQFVPDKLFYEPQALSKSAQKTLKDKGHELSQVNRQYGDMQVIYWNKKTGEVSAAADPRGEGLARIEQVSGESSSGR